MKKSLILFLFAGLFSLSINAQQESFSFVSESTIFLLSEDTQSTGTIAINPSVEDIESNEIVNTIEIDVEYAILPNVEYTISGIFTMLSIEDNGLSQLNVIGLTSLAELFCQNNKLHYLKISGLVNLTSLNCSNNKLFDLVKDNTSSLNTFYGNAQSPSLISLIPAATAGFISQSQYVLTPPNSFLIENNGITFENGYFLSQLPINGERNFTTNLDWGDDKMLTGTLNFETLPPSFVFRSVNKHFRLKSSTELLSGEITISPSIEDANGVATNLVELNTNYIITPNVEYTVTGYFIKLNIGYNNLDLLDVRRLTALTELDCGKNFHITNLDVSTLRNLQYLKCGVNDMVDLDVSSLTNLQTLDVRGNKHKVLDLSHNLNLRRLVCHGNQISSLDLSANSELEYLECYQNGMTILNLVGVRNSMELLIGYNALLGIDRSPNMPFPILYSAFANQDLAVHMLPDGNGGFISEKEYSFTPGDILTFNEQNIVFQNRRFRSVGPINNYTSSFSTNLGWGPEKQIKGTLRFIINSRSSSSHLEINNLISEDSENDYSPSYIKSYVPEKRIAIYPNPVQNSLHIEAEEEVLEVSVYDLRGRLLINEKLNDLYLSLSVLHLESGVYILKLLTESGSKNFRITKQ